MKAAVYSGSFDPITLGHVDIIRRVQPFFQPLTVLVASAEGKQYFFSLEERVNLVKKSLDGLNVEVQACPGLVVDKARELGAQVLIRGLRGVSDFENERAMAQLNKKLAPEIETFFVFSSPEQAATSSRLVKEIARGGGALEGLLPQPVIEALKKRRVL
ncbi:MAG: pantetheine-phosphate adenylyltransferase [Bdellovibrio sp.]|nr:MAG: pantetheine-phosphate adenylyltransferase [Bdellovibrio sp.]